MAENTQKPNVGRGLLTDAERAALAGERSDSYRYKTRSYLKDRIKQVDRDAEVLAEHAPDLLAELEAAVCDAGESDGETRHTTPGDQPTDRTNPKAEPTTTADDTGRETVDRTPEPEGDQSPSETPPTPTPTEDGSAFDGVDFPGGRDREQCVEAINAAREYLREQGPATMRQIVAAVHPEHPLGYDAEAAVEKVEAGERYRGAWWRRIVKPGLEAAEDVQPPATGQSDYRYTGGDQ